MYYQPSYLHKRIRHVSRVQSQEQTETKNEKAFMFCFVTSIYIFHHSFHFAIMIFPPFSNPRSRDFHLGTRFNFDALIFIFFVPLEYENLILLIYSQ